MIYLDHSSTTPLHPQVLEAMLPYLQEAYGNPGSAHRLGRDTKAAIDAAREQVAEALQVDAREIIFTSGGTESNYLILSSWAALGAKNGKQKLVTSAIEHPAVLDNVQALAERHDLQAIVLPVNEQGVINPEDLLEHLPYAACVSIMTANNETGVIQPVEAVGTLCREHEVPFHTDAVQALGKLPLNCSTLPIDALSISGHKINGPKGIGALYLKQGTPYRSISKGGGQERGRRSGTENVAGIVGLGKACTLISTSKWKHCEGLRNTFQNSLIEAIPYASVNGGHVPRLPHILNMGFQGCEGADVVMGLDAAGIAVATGAACHSGVNQASHVLLAMGQDHPNALSAVRFSLGPGTTKEDLETVAQATRELVGQLRA